MANMLCKPKHLSLDPQHPSIYNNEGGKGPCSRINERGAWGKGGGRERNSDRGRQTETDWTLNYQQNQNMMLKGVHWGDDDGNI